MMGHQQHATRTSPFGHYSTCECGWVSSQYREDDWDAYLDYTDHLRTEQLEAQAGEDYDDTLCDACQRRPRGHGHWAMYCEPCSVLPYGQVAP